MDPLTMALMMKALAAGVQGVSAGATALQGVDRLSSDEKNRMKELERNQALGLLGLDESQEQRILNQQLQPVQASLREALNRQQQRGLIEDVGQGATARSEAALLEAQNKAKATALETARDQITEIDQLEKAAQQRELAALKRTQVENRQRIASGLGQMGSAAISAYGDYQAAPEMAASIKAREAALLKNLAEETGEKAISDTDNNEYSEMLGMEQQKPTPTRQELIEALSSSPESVENQSKQKPKEVPEPKEQNNNTVINPNLPLVGQMIKTEDGKASYTILDVNRNNEILAIQYSDGTTTKQFNRNNNDSTTKAVYEEFDRLLAGVN